MRTPGQPNMPKPGDIRFALFRLEDSHWLFCEIFYAPSRKQAAKQYRDQGMRFNKSERRYYHIDDGRPTKLVADPNGMFANGDVLPRNWDALQQLDRRNQRSAIDTAIDEFEKHRETKAAEQRAELQRAAQVRREKERAAIQARMKAEPEKVETCKHCGRDIIQVTSGGDTGWYDGEHKWLCEKHIIDGEADAHEPRVLDLPSEGTLAGWDKVETDHD